MDSTSLVPYAVFALATILLLLLKVGRDILVPVFLLPWTALTPDVGVRLPIGEFLFLVLALKYLAMGKNLFVRFPNMWLVGLATCMGVASAAITLARGGVDIDFEGGVLRNGSFRVVVVLSSFLISLLPIALMSVPRVKIASGTILRAFLISVLMLSALGIVQYIIFHATGNDIFPLGLFSGAEDLMRSGLGTAVGGAIDLRPGSLAGEPKDLGMFATTAVILIAVLGRSLIRPRYLRWAALGGLALTIYLTQSTSALIALPVGLGIYALVKMLGRPLSAAGIFFLYCGISLTLTVMFLYNVSTTVPSFYAETAMVTANPNSVIELIYSRSIGRMSVEDFDWVILKSFLADPSAFVLGRGFGLGHLGTDPFIPPVWAHYMAGRIIFPKTGLTYFLVNGGAVFVLIMMGFLALLTPVLRGGSDASDRRRVEYVKRAQLILIPMIVLLILRIYVYEIALLIAGTLIAEERRHLEAQARAWFAAVKDRERPAKAFSLSDAISR